MPSISGKNLPLPPPPPVRPNLLRRLRVRVLLALRLLALRLLALPVQPLLALRPLLKIHFLLDCGGKQT